MIGPTNDVIGKPKVDSNGKYDATVCTQSGINDTGTAVEAISAQTRVLLAEPGAVEPMGEKDVSSPHVTVPPLSAEALIGDAFRGVSSDAASKVEVVLFIIECLRAISRLPVYAEAGAAMIEEVAARADIALQFEPDRQAVRAAASNAAR